MIAEGVSTRVLPPPPVRRSLNSVIRPGPFMSVRSARGASQEIQGSRKNVLGQCSGLTSRSRIADSTCCWRAARVRSSSFGLHLFSRTRAKRSAVAPFRWWSPLFSRKRLPPNEFELMQLSSVMSMPPIASISFGKFVKLTRTMWLILRPCPMKASTVLIVRAGPPMAKAALMRAWPCPGI